MAGLGEVDELLRAFRQRNAEALERLARKGIDLEGRDPAGRTVLMLAAEVGEPGAVQWILEAGARVDGRAVWQEVGGRDALMIAAAQGHGGVVDLLLAAGASATAVDDGGNRAIDLAAEAGHRDIVDRLRCVSGGEVEAASTKEALTAGAKPATGVGSLAAERGLGRFDGEDEYLLMRGAPADVATWWRRRCRAEIWLQDAYGEDVLVQGPCYLVFRFRDQDWTVVRAVHETADPGFGAEAAAAWAKQAEGESLFLLHSASQRRLVYRYFRGRDGRHREDWPPLTALAHGSADEWLDAFNDDFADRIADSYLDPIVDSYGDRFDGSEPAGDGWVLAQRRVDAHLRRLGAYVPSWGRPQGGDQRLEVAGLAPDAFERMDFLAL